MPTRCIRCNRKLTDPDSIRRGFGPVCARKMGYRLDRTNGSTPSHEYQDVTIYDAPLFDRLILRRGEDDTPMTNVPHAVEHHSTNGFEWGYAGSGPADLALNIVHYFVNRMDNVGFGDTKSLNDGSVDRLTFYTYQRFKRDYLQGADRDGFSLDADQIRRWIETRVQELKATTLL